MCICLFGDPFGTARRACRSVSFALCHGTQAACPSDPLAVVYGPRGEFNDSRVDPDPVSFPSLAPDDPSRSLARSTRDSNRKKRERALCVLLARDTCERNASTN